MDNQRQNSIIIKEALIDFICEKCGNGNREEIIEALDEIIVNYVVNVLEDEVDLKQRQKRDDFDPEEFSDMISAYFPTFGDIPKDEVKGWMDGLVKRIIVGEGKSTIGDNENGCKDGPQDSLSTMSQKLSIVLNLIPDTSSSPHSRTSSVSTDADNDDLFFLSSGEHGEGGGGEGIRRRVRCSSSTSSNSNELHNLAEMFPNYKTQDLSMVLNMANNDMEKAVQILLLDESMLDGVGVVKKTKNKGGIGTEGGEQSNHLEEEGEDFRKDLKDRLVARYGFIDKAQDVKEHRPILPKSEPKKMLRYRDGQVVSTKGEKYTEVRVTSTGEEVKIRSYLSRSQRQAVAEGRLSLN